MSLTLWRVIKSRYGEEALSGEGARRYGGRWSSPGIPVIYCAEHLSLAVLEILVHTQRNSMLSGYVQLSLRIQEEQIASLSAAVLPENWQDPFPGNDLQSLGDAWFSKGEYLALAVPSAVLPQEKNYLINPRHADFSYLSASPPETLALDPRLFLSQTGR